MKVPLLAPQGSDASWRKGFGAPCRAGGRPAGGGAVRSRPVGRQTVRRPRERGLEVGVRAEPSLGLGVASPLWWLCELGASGPRYASERRVKKLNVIFNGPKTN